MTAELVVRPARPEDLPRVAELAARLVRLHHSWDEKRFLLVEPVEKGYAWFLGKELARAEAVVDVAVLDGEIVGYTYGALEGRDWNALLDAHGALHDVLVDERARGRGVGEALVRATVARLEALGAQRVVLATAIPNEGARRLFSKLGFRSTMIEMTRERGER